MAACPWLDTGPLTHLTRLCYCRCRRRSCYSCCSCCWGMHCMAGLAAAVVAARQRPTTGGSTTEGSSSTAGQCRLAVTPQATHTHRHSAGRARARPRCCQCCCCSCRHNCRRQRQIRRRSRTTAPLAVTAAAAAVAIGSSSSHCCCMGLGWPRALKLCDSWRLAVVAGAAAAGVTTGQCCATWGPAGCERQTDTKHFFMLPVLPLLPTSDHLCQHRHSAWVSPSSLLHEVARFHTSKRSAWCNRGFTCN